MELLRDFGRWTLAVLTAWYGWLAGSAIAGAIGIGEGLKWWKPNEKTYIGLISIGIVVSFFEAWRRERVANRNGPQVLVEWGRGSFGDVVRLRNIGDTSALTVEVEPFSWPELSWVRPILVQAIHSKTESVMNAEFAESTSGDGHSQQMGYLGNILGDKKYKGRKPLELTISFSDANLTRWTRVFTCHPNIVQGHYINRDVIVRMGKLKMKRD